MTTGSCLCGTVRWRIEGPYERMSHCHCSMCRKTHGAPFGTYIVIPEGQFEMLAGGDAVTTYVSSDHFSRNFCSGCGSVVPFAIGERRAVPAGCLDGDPGVRPNLHIFVGSKAPWHVIADDLPQYAEHDSDGEPVAPGSSRPSGKTPDVLHGSCLCGGVAFEAETPILAVYNCHCTRCRKARAAAHTTNGFVDPKGLKFTKGEDLLKRYKVPEAKSFTQAFCRICGSGMPNLDQSRPRVGIPFGSLDNDPGIGAGDHIFCGFKAPWYEIGDDIPQHHERP